VDTNGNNEEADDIDEVDDGADDNPDDQDDPEYSFNVGGLPTWAKKQVNISIMAGGQGYKFLVN
jgi:hypothetical protein